MIQIKNKTAVRKKLMQVGETRTLSCMAEGNPQPQYQWLHKFEEKVSTPLWLWS